MTYENSAKEDMINDFNLSLYRRFGMNILAKQKFNGTIVDLGGAKISNYHKLLRGVDEIIRVNFDEKYGCEIIADIEKPIPLDSKFADHILCLNVLEHTFCYNNVLNEAYRILKKDGSFCLMTPFLFQIHSSPYDYFRYTNLAIERILLEIGFREIEIIPIGYGLVSLFYQLSYGGWPRITRRIIENIAIFSDEILTKKTNLCNVNSFPMGYFTIAKK